MSMNKHRKQQEQDSNLLKIRTQEAEPPHQRVGQNDVSESCVLECSGVWVQPHGIQCSHWVKKTTFPSLQTSSILIKTSIKLGCVYSEY